MEWKGIPLFCDSGKKSGGFRSIEWSETATILPSVQWFVGMMAGCALFLAHPPTPTPFLLFKLCAECARLPITLSSLASFFVSGPDRAIGPAIAVMSDAQPNFQLPWPLPLLGTHGHCTVSIVLREADEVSGLREKGGGGAMGMASVGCGVFPPLAWETMLSNRTLLADHHLPCR